MYKFHPYWTDKLKIDFLQRVILIHSYLYYIKDSPVWSDKKFDEIAKQLVQEQSKHSKVWIKQETQYGYIMKNFDGSTGFDLCYKLKEKDKEQISAIANWMVKKI